MNITEKFMSHYLVISAIGNDRPSIVNSVSQMIVEHKGNITSSRMMAMGGEFALMLMVEGDSKVIEQIRSALPEMESSLGLTVVSGMARGIDTAAHTGALIGKGKTIPVLGSGFEKVYPSENLTLFRKIAENGAVITEFPLMTDPDPYNFPIRNRIISGISLGTVIVEATKRSGSLITARLAAEQNREVFAVPGSVQSFKSTGTHTLIKQGAKLVEHAQDIVEELSQIIHAQATDKKTAPGKMEIEIPPLSREESIVVELLEPYPVHIDTLVRKLSMESGKLSSILMRLELKGIVVQLPGKFFVKADK